MSSSFARFGPIHSFFLRAARRLRSFSMNPMIREVKAQLIIGYLPEPDFIIFSLLKPSRGLVIDVGANRGHCSIVVLRDSPGLSVLAFEPGPSLGPPLKYLKRRFPDRFNYEPTALGSHRSEGDLMTPGSGSLRISTNASLRHSEFEKEHVQERLQQETRQTFDSVKFSHTRVSIRTLDEFNLAPLAIKIDVEGLEAEVIRGALKTLQQHRPMLLIEMNNHEEFLPILAELGYLFYRFCATSIKLVPLPKNEVYLNVICIHPDNRIVDNDLLDCDSSA